MREVEDTFLNLVLDGFLLSIYTSVLVSLKGIDFNSLKPDSVDRQHQCKDVCYQ